MKKPQPILSIIGPTAVGKTSLSLALARELHAEVISVDSRQVYRYMDVGTDKASVQQRHDTLHHLIDVVDPDQVFTASDFVSQGTDAVKRITARQRVPLFAGGTPFYYQALFSRLLSIDVEPSEELRNDLEQWSSEELHDQLAELDGVTARRLHVNDRFRLIRALEICLLTGEKLSDLKSRSSEEAASPFNVLYIGLTRKREHLCDIIAQRVTQQFHSGYPEEVAWLLDQGYSPDLPSMLGFGYRELVQFHQGHMTFQEALESDIVATRQFAKRQMTWFRKFNPVQWFDLDELTGDEAYRQVLEVSRRHLEL